MDAHNEKFFVARDVIVDETNMINSRSKSQMKLLNESKEGDQIELLNESKEGDQEKFLNESTENNDSMFPSDSRKGKFLNESKENNVSMSPNDSKKGKLLNESKKCDEINVLNESKDDVETEIRNETTQTKFDPEQPSECVSRRSDRLKNRPQISYTEDEFDFERYKEKQSRRDKSLWEEAVENELNGLLGSLKM